MAWEVGTSLVSVLRPTKVIFLAFPVVNLVGILSRSI